MDFFQHSFDDSLIEEYELPRTPNPERSQSQELNFPSDQQSTEDTNYYGNPFHDMISEKLNSQHESNRELIKPLDLQTEYCQVKSQQLSLPQQMSTIDQNKSYVDLSDPLLASTIKQSEPNDTQSQLSIDEVPKLPSIELENEEKDFLFNESWDSFIEKAMNQYPDLNITSMKTLDHFISDEPIDVKTPKILNCVSETNPGHNDQHQLCNAEEKSPVQAQNKIAFLSETECMVQTNNPLSCTIKQTHSSALIPDELTISHANDDHNILTVTDQMKEHAMTSTCSLFIEEQNNSILDTGKTFINKDTESCKNVANTSQEENLNKSLVQNSYAFKEPSKIIPEFPILSDLGLQIINENFPDKLKETPVLSESQKLTLKQQDFYLHTCSSDNKAQEDKKNCPSDKTDLENNYCAIEDVGNNFTTKNIPHTSHTITSTSQETGIQQNENETIATDDIINLNLNFLSESPVNSKFGSCNIKTELSVSLNIKEEMKIVSHLSNTPPDKFANDTLNSKENIKNAKSFKITSQNTSDSDSNSQDTSTATSSCSSPTNTHKVNISQNILDETRLVKIPENATTHSIPQNSSKESSGSQDTPNVSSIFNITSNDAIHEALSENITKETINTPDIKYDAKSYKIISPEYLNYKHTYHPTKGSQDKVTSQDVPSTFLCQPFHNKSQRDLSFASEPLSIEAALPSEDSMSYGANLSDLSCDAALPDFCEEAALPGPPLDIKKESTYDMIQNEIPTMGTTRIADKSYKKTTSTQTINHTYSSVFIQTEISMSDMAVEFPQTLKRRQIQDTETLTLNEDSISAKRLSQIAPSPNTKEAALKIKIEKEVSVLAQTTNRNFLRLGLSRKAKTNTLLQKKM